MRQKVHNINSKQTHLVNYWWQRWAALFFLEVRKRKVRNNTWTVRNRYVSNFSKLPVRNAL